MFHLPCQACFERANRSTPKRLCGTQKGRPLYGGSVGLTGLTTVVLVSLCGDTFFCCSCSTKCRARIRLRTSFRCCVVSTFEDLTALHTLVAREHRVSLRRG